MDSCHIFNFLFGTRKATSELRKCFASRSSSSGETNEEEKKSGREKSSNTATTTDAGRKRTKSGLRPPVSPFKQIQLKIINFASGAQATVTGVAGRHEDESDVQNGVQPEAGPNSGDVRSLLSVADGTYKATLVELPLEFEEGEEEEEEIRVSIEAPLSSMIGDENNNICTTISMQKITSESVATDTGPEFISATHDAGQISANLGQDCSNESSQQLVQTHKDVHLYINPSQTIEADARVSHDSSSDSHVDRVLRTTTIRTEEVDDMSQKKTSATKKTQTLERTYSSERVRHLVRSFESFEGPNDNAFSRDEEGSPPPLPTSPNSSGPKPGSVRVAWPPPTQAAQPLVQPMGLEDLIETRERVRPAPLTQLVQRKPTTIVKPMPPATPPKSKRVKCFNHQLSLNKPRSIEQLFQDENFLKRHFFEKLEPLDRCSAAQVCRQWRNILYSNQAYWRDIVGVIDCTELRREHLVECIANTLQSARSKQQGAELELDEDEIWRIQELCNKYARGAGVNANNAETRQRALVTSGAGGTNHQTHNHHNQQQHHQSQPQHQHHQTQENEKQQQHQQLQQQQQHQQQQQQQTTTTCMANSKSSSIPSQISSTLSSVSISSLLSPLSESSRVDSIRERLYLALDERGFDAICMFGATDDDIEELICKTRPNGVQRTVRLGRLNNCSITDRGLELFVSSFSQLEELELTGCNELTNNLMLKPLAQLRRLIITDCINIADGLAQRLLECFHQLDEIVIQAYHLTDAFLEYISLNCDTNRLRRLELPNCKEISNTSMLTIAKHFTSLEALSISGSTRISDDGLEILCEHAEQLRSLDLGWCTKITDVTLECIACDLSANLRELILDRNVHITDIGLGYLATMSQLTLLYIRWCPGISDLGIESILTMRTLRHLSVAGLQQLTARSLLCLPEASNLEEVELTNCPAVNSDLMHFLQTRMPKCNIIF